MCDDLSNLFNDILDEHALIKRIKIHGCPNPYVTEEIPALIRTRDQWKKEPRKAKIHMPGHNIRPVAKGKVRNSAGRERICKAANPEQ